jgi:hypothetical protein
MISDLNIDADSLVGAELYRREDDDDLMMYNFKCDKSGLYLSFVFPLARGDLPYVEDYYLKHRSKKAEAV